MGADRTPILTDLNRAPHSTWSQRPVVLARKRRAVEVTGEEAIRGDVSKDKTELNSEGEGNESSRIGESKQV